MPKSEMYVTKAGARRFQVSAPLREETYQALRQLAFEEETTLAAQVRKAAEEYVARTRSASSKIR
jgi:hypothetical protein